jgi:cytochrome c biogenesis protein CcdA
MSEQPSFFAELKQVVTVYLEAKIQLYKIGTYEKVAKVTAVLFSSLFIIMIGFFFLLFLGITAGLFFGSLLNNNALGFLIITGIYFILFVIVFVFRKKILEKYITDKVIEQLFEKEDND